MSAMSQLTWPTILSRLLSGLALTEREASWAMDRIMSGDATPAQVGAFVAALRAKVTRLVNMSWTFRAHAAWR